MSPNLSPSFLAVALIFSLALCTAPLSAAQSTPSFPAPDQSPSTSLEKNQSAQARRFRRSLARVYPLLQRYGVWAGAAATLAEGIGIPAPGQTLLIAGAVEAAEGRMNIALLLLLEVAAATVGNSVGYVIGRWGGRFVLNKLKVNPQRQQRLDELFKRHGGLVVLLGRFVDGLRQLNGVLAGIMKMPWWSFTAYNVAGALLWTGAWGLGAYYLGRKIHFIAAFLHHHRGLLFAVSVTALLALLGYLLRSKNTATNNVTSG
jgi:membrane protein DedA with SNARE-associated domain